MTKSSLIAPPLTFTRISEHVYWMTPGKPDRPSLAAVVGERYTLMLDAGASAEHARLFLDGLRAAGVATPQYVALTHWHWDHIFGAAEIGVPVIAHQQTAEQMRIQAGYEWTDTALDQRVVSGEEIAFCADNIKLELPEPRDIQIVLPDLVFSQTLTLDLGGVTCAIQHVGGDHAADSCVMQILPDRVLFLGDCLYDAIYTPVRHYTTQRLLPLLDTLATFDADMYIEGHSPSAMNRAEFDALVQKLRLAAQLVQKHGTDETVLWAAAKAQSEFDEDLEEMILACFNGLGR